MFITFGRVRAFGTEWILSSEEEPQANKKYVWKDDLSWVDAYIWKDLGAWILNTDTEPPSSRTLYAWDDFTTWYDDNIWKDGTVWTT